MVSEAKLKTEFSRSEVVRVDSPSFLVSSAHRACRYEAGAGIQMSPGHYLVLWPVEADQSLYGRELLYFGPFVTLDVARLLEASVLALGIVAPDVARPASPNPSRRKLRQRTRPGQAPASPGWKTEPCGVSPGAEIGTRPAAADFDAGTGC